MFCSGGFAGSRPRIMSALLMSLVIIIMYGYGAAGADQSLVVDGMSPDQLYALSLAPKAHFKSVIRLWNPSIGDLEVTATGYGDVVVYSLRLLEHEYCLAVNGNTTVCYGLPVDRSCPGGGGVTLIVCEDQITRFLLAMLVPVGNDLPLLVGNYSIEKSAGFYYGGRESVKVKLGPKLPGNVGRTAWIDKASGVLLSLEDVNYCGDVIQRLQTLQLDCTPELDEERLKWARLALTMAARDSVRGWAMTVDYASQVLGFKIAEPKWIPPGYQLAGVRVLQGLEGSPSLAGGVGGVAQLVYYDGLGMISLYERSVPWWAASTLEPEAGNVIEWETCGIRYVLAGDIDPGLLLKMARSVG